MSSGILDLLRRALRKPPQVLIRRLAQEVRAEADRFFAPRRANALGDRVLLECTEASSLSELWNRLASRPFVCPIVPDSPNRERILEGADRAMNHRVDLLGSGPKSLGQKIDWHTDFKTGLNWTPAFFRGIDYNNPERPSDVKVAWELSRMQWLIPVAQAFHLTRSEPFAAFILKTIDDWISSNPYASSVNWACTMEAALRILTWTYLFHACNSSIAWRDTAFQSRFLRALYLHADFTERYIERSDVNGNHFTADAAALVFAGLFFEKGKTPERWLQIGWTELNSELPRQVFSDGVDFEGSVAYHQFVYEFFQLPAVYREKCGLATPPEYRQRLSAMESFIQAFTRPDGSIPLWGDADDGHALPVRCSRLLDASPKVESVAFPLGGFYIMRNGGDHVFIDCGPVGMAGRGGHGHNDCLAFEAVLNGAHLVTDCGAYVYTASYEERNRFRSTAFHNTPRIDGVEINRFVSPDNLWSLRNEAVPEIRRWEPGATHDQFQGTHSGYMKLANPVRPVRTIVLDHTRHALLLHDGFEGSGDHAFEIPIHLAPGVSAHADSANRMRLSVPDNSGKSREFILQWSPVADWTLHVEAGRCSPSYGVAVPIVRLAFRREGTPRPLTVVLTPAESAADTTWIEPFTNSR